MSQPRPTAHQPAHSPQRREHWLTAERLGVTAPLSVLSCCILVSSEVSHLIATLVKRLWLSYTTGLHIPATRWIWILSCKESPDRCGTCAIYRTANYHTGAGNCQYPWCDLNVPLVTLMVKHRMYFLLPEGAKKCQKDIWHLKRRT